MKILLLLIPTILWAITDQFIKVNNFILLQRLIPLNNLIMNVLTYSCPAALLLALRVHIL